MRHFVITFNDLKEEKQQEIKESLREELIGDKVATMIEAADMDLYEFDKDVESYMEGVIELGTRKAWCEMGVDDGLED